MHPSEVITRKRNTLTALQTLNPYDERADAAFLARLAVIMTKAPNYFVTEDMVTLCKAAGETLPANPPMHDELLPSQDGYLLYDAPIMNMVDPRDGEITHIVGFFWLSSPEKHALRFFPLISRIQVEEMSDLPIVSHSEVWYYLEEPLPSTTDWGDGESDELNSVYDQPPCPLLYATWVLMAETLIETTTEQADRAERKRCQRENSPSTVVLARLRRVARDSSHQTGSADYSHRFLVSGHWRRQYHPSDKSHRMRYILPYVKGPEDKPLVIKNRVTILER